MNLLQFINKGTSGFDISIQVLDINTKNIVSDMQVIYTGLIDECEITTEKLEQYNVESYFVYDNILHINVTEKEK